MKLKKTLPFLALLTLTNWVSGQTLDQSNTGTNNWETCTTDGQIVGQSFTAGLTGKLSGIAIDFQINSCKNLTKYKFVADIISGSGYSGAILATDTVTIAVPFSRTMLPINFKNTPNITSGQQYTIRLTPTPKQICDTISSKPQYVCAQWLESASNTYTLGVPYLNGAVDNSGDDKYFNTYVLVCGEITDQSNTGTNNWETCTTNGQIVGQSFTAGKTGSLSSIEIDFQINSCKNLTKYKFATDIINGNGYSGAVLATDTVTISIPFTRAMLPINFIQAPKITSGQQYTIRLTPVPNQICDTISSKPQYVCAEWLESASDTYTLGIPYLNGAQDNVYDKYFITNITPNSFDTISVTSAGTYTSPSGNHVWTTSNTYMDTLTNAGGCDSIITIHLTIGTTGILKNNEKQTISVYPNPASDQIIIQVNSNLVGSSYSVADLFGRTIISGKISSEKSGVDLLGLYPGVYLISVGTGNKNQFKIIKQ